MLFIILASVDFRHCVSFSCVCRGPFSLLFCPTGPANTSALESSGDLGPFHSCLWRSGALSAVITSLVSLECPGTPPNASLRPCFGSGPLFWLTPFRSLPPPQRSFLIISSHCYIHSAGVRGLICLQDSISCSNSGPLKPTGSPNEPVIFSLSYFSPQKAEKPFLPVLIHGSLLTAVS